MSDQSPERIVIEGRMYDLCSEPFYDYIARCGILLGDECRSSNLLRGYVGTWMIDRNRLYLIDLDGALPNGAQVTVETFFPEFSSAWWNSVLMTDGNGIIAPGSPEVNERVFARWYTGKLLISQGKILERNGIGHGGLFEKLLTIDVEKGRVVSEKVEEPGGFL